MKRLEQFRENPCTSLLRNSPTSTNATPYKTFPAKTPAHFPPAHGTTLSPEQTPFCNAPTSTLANSPHPPRKAPFRATVAPHTNQNGATEKRLTVAPLSVRVNEKETKTQLPRD